MSPEQAAAFLQNPEKVRDLARHNPDALSKLVAASQHQHRLTEREVYENSLLAFFKRAWREIDPAELDVNWHHEVIIEHLEAVTYGEIRNLIINIPPRHTKTLLVNVIFPAWTWARGENMPLSGPHVKFLSVSYGAILAEEIALKMRRLVMGDWYQSTWGDRVQILEDQKSRANLGNTAGGERLSNSIEGGILGRGGDIQIIDDPQTRKGADSPAERAASLQGMSDLMTRFTDPRITAKILIMQRLHMQDATDWALKNWPKNTVHLMFPARFDSSWPCQQDVRTHDGELLWPSVWTEEELSAIEKGLSALDGEHLSDYAISGQLQQNPIPRGGGIINPDDWQIWPEHTPRREEMRELPGGLFFIPLPDTISHVILSLDTAMSEENTADYNALVVLGVWHRPKNLVNIVGYDDPVDDGEQPRAIMMGGWRMRGRLNSDQLDHRGEPMGLVQRIIATARRFNAAEIVIENKSRGLDVKNEIARQIGEETFKLRLFQPGKHGDKVARLHSVQPLFSQSLVYAPAKCDVAQTPQGLPYVRVGEFAWVRSIMDEVSQVPKGAHDDYADAISQGLITLREDGYLALTREYVQQQLRMRLHRPRRDTVKEGYGV